MNRWYRPWVNAGKPYRAAMPIAEVVARLKAARPAAAAAKLFGSIGDYAHLTATLPKDHTPYSQTGWPGPSPYGVGFATDIMHRPDLDLDCFLIFAHWIAEARAGRLPWLKYLIWRAKIYHVRNNWEPDDSSGHFDHIHVSARTDHVDTGIGDFDPLGDDMADTPGDVAAHYRLLALMTLNPAYAAAPQIAKDGRLPVVPLIDLLLRLDSTSRSLTTTVQALAESINAGGGSIETAAILARIDERADEDVARDNATAARIAELEQQLAEATERAGDSARAAAAAYPPDATPVAT